MCKSIVGMANINAKNFKILKYLFPPVILHNKYAGYVEKLNETEQNLLKGIDESNRLFNSLTQRAFHGKL